MTSLITNHSLRVRLAREAMRRGVAVVPYAPLFISIDPCNLCNLRCTFCPQSHWGARERGMMEFQLYQMILKQVLELRPHLLSLYCNGEPLLHPQIFQMVALAETRGQRVRIVTNGKNLDEARARALLASGLTELHISLDSADRATYNRMRHLSDFDVVVENIGRLLRLKTESGCRHPQIFLDELIPFTPGADPQNTPEYKKLFVEGVKTNARFLYSFAGSSGEQVFPAFVPAQSSPCKHVYTRMVVGFDGRVQSCVLDSQCENQMGDVSTSETLAGIWNGETMKTLRRRLWMHEVAGLKPCETCEELHDQGGLQKYKSTPLDKLIWWMISPVSAWA